MTSVCYCFRRANHTAGQGSPLYRRVEVEVEQRTRSGNEIGYLLQ